MINVRVDVEGYFPGRSELALTEPGQGRVVEKQPVKSIIQFDLDQPLYVIDIGVVNDINPDTPSFGIHSGRTEISLYLFG